MPRPKGGPGAGGQNRSVYNNPELEEIEPQPLDMSIPTDSCRSALTYFALLPIVLPLWLTLPDTRKQSGES